VQLDIFEDEMERDALDIKRKGGGIKSFLFILSHSTPLSFHQINWFIFIDNYK
jgi:hypothetical protein